MFAALEVATGKVSADACYARHTNIEFLRFLKLVAKTPSGEAARHRGQLRHPQPPQRQRQATRRGTFHSVKDLRDAIRAFIDAYNDRCEPFTWTKTADELLAKIRRQGTSNTRH